MKRILSIFIALLVTAFVDAQDLNQIRSDYPNAVESEEITSKLDAEFSSTAEPDKPVLLAYKGAVTTLVGKFAKGIGEKIRVFKQGVSLIEKAVAADPLNPEIRYIRMSVQENAPRILDYHNNIEEDKEFILKNYKNVSSKGSKDIIRDFVLNSKNFSEDEKADIK